MRKKFRSIIFKISFIVATAMLVAFLLFSIILQKEQRRIFMEYLNLDMNSIAETIINSLELDMMTNNSDAINKTIKSIGNQDLIKELRIIDHSGKVCAAKNESEMGKIFYKTKNKKCLICHARGNPKKNSSLVFYEWGTANSCKLKGITPIYNKPKCYNAPCHAHSKNEKILGFLDMAVCTKNLYEAQKQVEKKIFFLSAFFIFLFSSIIILTIRKFITNPIKILVNGTNKVASGNFNVKLSIKNRDEIGKLAWAFNIMVEKIDELTKKLEKKVEIKTEKLQLAQKRIVEAEKMSSLGRLAAVIAHEINNPISGLVVFINLIRKQLKKESLSQKEINKIEEQLKLMESEAKRCGNMVTELLAFSRNEFGSMHPVNVKKTILKACKMMELKIKDKNIFIKTDIHENLPIVKGDPNKLQQVFMNLIQNSIDAMPMGGEINIRAKYNENENNIEIEVKDEGIGIPKEHLKHIFEPFYSSKEDGKGVGIGLFVVYGIINQFGGNISVSSEINRGTTFFIKLPIGESIKNE